MYLHVPSIDNSAQTLGVTERTVETYLYKVCNKVEVDTRVEMFPGSWSQEYPFNQTVNTAWQRMPCIDLGVLEHASSWSAYREAPADDCRCSERFSRARR